MNPKIKGSTQAPGHLFCFGLGYTAGRLAKRLLTNGWQVSGTVRSSEKQSYWKRQGISTSLFDTHQPLASIDRIFQKVTHCLISIPPQYNGDLVLLKHSDDLIRSSSLKWIAYLSTPSVYGDWKGKLVKESDEPNPGSTRGHRRLNAERAWLSVMKKTVAAVQIFRLSGIYGPERSVFDQIRAGTARIIEKPGQVFNRIHVDDIGKILCASMARPNSGQIYNVADGEPCSSGEVIRHACHMLGVASPAPIPFESANMSQMARSFYSECKRLDTHRIAEELGVTLDYPTYREGLEAILGAEKSGDCNPI